MGNVDPKERRTPDSFGIRARLSCWWWCLDERHEWFNAAPLDHRLGFTCPFCSAERVAARRARWDRLNASLVAEVPEIVAAWRDERSYVGLRVSDLGRLGWDLRNYELRCEAGHKVNTVWQRFLDAGCPWCRGNKTRGVEAKSLAEDDPEVAALWHPTRNGNLTPETTPTNYRKVLWWRGNHCCGHEWEEALVERRLGRRPQAGRGHYYCPRCESTYGSLAWLDPELATEWHENNGITPWHVRPYTGGVVVKWRCSTDPAHEWEAPVMDRSAGRLCPHCSTAGVSNVEREFLAAAQEIDGEAHASRIGRWRVDVLMPSVNMVIEYDGEYWHREKQELDTRKTRSLIAAGYLVARIRENDLGDLDLTDLRLLQVAFRPSFGESGDLVRQIYEWAERVALTTAPTRDPRPN